jgi:hypothetical protein
VKKRATAPHRWLRGPDRRTPAPRGGPRRSPERGAGVATADAGAAPAAPAGSTDAFRAEAFKNLPDAVQGPATAAIPAIVAVIAFMQACIPYLEKAWDLALKVYEFVAPYEGLQQMIFGFVLVFFGGTFITTIAAWEAFKMCGYDKTKACIADLYVRTQKSAVACDSGSISGSIPSRFACVRFRRTTRSRRSRPTRTT